MPRRLRTTAAWRISIWTATAFAIGSAIAFSIVYLLVAQSIRQRSDAWLIGEADTLAQVAEDTPRDSLYDRIVEEVAEPDGTPLRVRLLGEKLVAFRDSDGGVGLVGEFCPHRGASLYFGRVDDDSMTCVVSVSGSFCRAETRTRDC